MYTCEGGGKNRNISHTFAHFDLLPTLKEGHPPLLIAKTRRPADAQKLLHRAAKPCGRGLALRWNLLCLSRDARPRASSFRQTHRVQALPRASCFTSLCPPLFCLAIYFSACVDIDEFHPSGSIDVLELSATQRHADVLPRA